MKVTRTLYVLAAIVVSVPALAADASYREASSEKIAAASSEPTVSDHSCEVWTDRDGKLHCRCTPVQPRKGKATSWTEPTPDYGG